MKGWDIAYVPLGAAAFGGAERSLIELASGAAKRGRRVGILAGRALEGTPFADAAAREGIDVVWCGWEPSRSLAHNALESVRCFGRARARVIHFNISWRSRMWVVPVVARLVTRAVLIGTMRAMPDPHAEIPRRRYLGFIPGLRLWHLPEVLAGRIWATLLRTVVSVNEGDYPPRLVRDFGFPRRKIRVVHNGIRLREGPLPEERRAEIRRAHGIGPEHVWACFVGRISAEKGTEPLIRCMSLLPESFRLVMVGDGPDRTALERLARESGLGQRVRFAGFVEEPRDLMAGADVVVVPSLWHEAFGRSVVEAMGEGVPVIASRIGGMAELFDDGAEGLYVAPGDPPSLARALERIGRDRDAARLMGAAGRRRAERDYALDRVVGQYDALYAECLEPGGGGEGGRARP